MIASDAFPEVLVEIFQSMTPVQMMLFGLIVAVFIVLIVAGFMGYFHIIQNIAYFAYPVARVKAIGNPYVKEEHVLELMESKNISECLSKIRKFGYHVGGEAETGIDRIENELQVLFLREYENLENTVPSGVRPFFDAYRMLLEAEQIKVALRAKRAGLQHEIERKVIPLGCISPPLIKRMAGAASMEDLVSQLHATPYGQVLSAAVPDYSRDRSTLPFDLALDRHVFQALQDALLHIDQTVAIPIHRFISSYTEVAMIKIILRGKAMGLDPDHLQKYLLPGADDATVTRLKRVGIYRDIPQILKEFSGAPYRGAIEQSLPDYEKTGSLTPIETALDAWLLDTAVSIGVTYHLWGGPLLTYLLAKQYEIWNIRAIIHGIQEGVPVETMRTVIVCERAAG